MEEAFNTLLNNAVERYGLRVTLANMDTRGAFNQTSIFIASTADIYERIFVLVHSIGHIAQWIHNPNKKEFSYQFQQRAKEGVKINIRLHRLLEIESAQYSLSFLHDSAVYFLDEWFLKYFQADQNYIEEYLSGYKPKEPERFKEWLMAGNSSTTAPLIIQSLPLPNFTKQSDSAEELIHIF